MRIEGATAGLPRAWSYTPRKVREWEQQVAWEARAAGWQCVEGEVELEVTFWSSRRWPGDLDNLLKSLLDGLNGVAYRDDRQVRRIVAELRHAEPGQDRVHVRLRTLDSAA